MVTRLAKNLDKIQLGKRKQPSPTPLHDDETDSDEEFKAYNLSKNKKIKILPEIIETGFMEYKIEILNHLINKQVFRDLIFSLALNKIISRCKRS